MRYRAYFLDPSYRYVDAETIESDSDDDALLEAARLHLAGGFADFELWQGPRPVYLCAQRQMKSDHRSSALAADCTD